ncbi:Arm DNA-binding domain-containing protein, partial [Massilia psychrophila]
MTGPSLSNKKVKKASAKVKVQEPLVAPPGIQFRRGKRSESIGFSFYCDNFEYRETLKLTTTKDNLEYAVRRRGEILNAITKGIFDYEEYFPNSLKARKLAESRKILEAAHPRNTTVEQLMKDYLSDRQQSLAPSSFNQYSNVTKTHILPKWKNIRIGDICAAEIRKWISSMSTKQKTIQANILPLNKALSRAKREKRLFSREAYRAKKVVNNIDAVHHAGHE